MKTNELSLQEMQQTNGGSAMPPMPVDNGAGDLTIMQAPTESPTNVPADTGMFGMWDRPQAGIAPYLNA